MRPVIVALIGTLGFLTGFGFHSIIYRPEASSPSSCCSSSAAPSHDVAIDARLNRIESSLEALHSTVFLAGTGESAGAAAKLSAETLVAALRDELRRQAPVADANAHQVDDAAAVEAQPENAPSFAEAQRTVESAVSAGRWTDEDAQSLHQNLAPLSGRQEKELLARLVPAINRGEIKVETSGPPF